MVIDKPPGMLSQGDISGESNVVEWARDYLGRHYVGLIHRLDRNVSGAMVIGKRTKSAKRLSEALVKGELKRDYVGLLEGTMEGESKWEHFLIKDTKNNTVRLASGIENGAKRACLKVCSLKRVCSKWGPLTFVSFNLETGRAHQIRVQSQAMGYPLVGDPKYGSNQSKTFGRPALHGMRVSFLHPMTQDRMTIEAPLPKDFIEILERC